VASAVTTTELGYVSGVTSAIQTQLGALSSSITGLSSVYQPLDSDLTALAALTTASYGRDFNTLANNAALATKIAALVPTWTGLHTFGANVAITEPASGNSLEIAAKAGQAGILLTAHSGSNAVVGLVAAGGGYQWDCRSDNSGNFTIRNATLSNVIAFQCDTTANPITSVNDNGTMREVGYRFLPYRDLTTTGSAAQTDNGEGIFLSGASFTLTLGALTDTTIITLFNVTATRTIAPGSGTLNWMNGSGTVGTGNRTLAVAAVATVFRAAGNWYIFGTGIS
jgi:hypothetical protein